MSQKLSLICVHENDFFYYDSFSQLLSTSHFSVKNMNALQYQNCLGPRIKGKLKIRVRRHYVA